MKWREGWESGEAVPGEAPAVHHSSGWATAYECLWVCHDGGLTPQQVTTPWVTPDTQHNTAAIFPFTVYGVRREQKKTTGPHELSANPWDGKAPIHGHLGRAFYLAAPTLRPEMAVQNLAWGPSWRKGLVCHGCGHVAGLVNRSKPQSPPPPPRVPLYGVPPPESGGNQPVFDDF